MTEEEKKKMAELEAENKKLKDEAKSAEEKKAADKEQKDKDYSDMAARCERLEKEAREAKVKAVVDKFSDRIPAEAMPKVKAIAQALASADECEFADGDGSKKMSALDAFGDVLCAVSATAEKSSVLDNQFDASEYSDKGDKGGKSDKGNPADIAAKM